VVISQDRGDVVAQYNFQRSVNPVHPTYAPISVEADSYGEYCEVVEALGSPPDVGWLPTEAGRAFRATAEVDLAHLMICAPTSRIDASLNGMVNSGALRSLLVIDPGAKVVSPFRLTEAWCGSLRLLYLDGPNLDAEMAAALPNLEMLNLRGPSVLNLEAVPRSVRYLSAEDCDVQNPDALADLQHLESIRLASCRKVPSVDALPFEKLPALRSLTLNGFSRSATLSFLKGLPSLEYLGLGGFSRVQDISPVLELPSLRLLNIWHPGLKNVDYSPLASLFGRPGFELLVGLRPKDMGLEKPPMPGVLYGGARDEWMKLLQPPLLIHYYR